MSEVRTLGHAEGVDFGYGGYPSSFYTGINEKGKKFVILNLNSTSVKEDTQAARAAGLDVAYFQGYDKAAWREPKQATIRATQAGNTLDDLGAPKNVTVFLDCEDMAGVGLIPALNWFNSWDNALYARGYKELGKYVGPNCPLNSASWYSLPLTKHYWMSGATVPSVERRGYQLIQTEGNATLAGETVDLDTARPDNLGGEVTVWAAPVAMETVPPAPVAPQPEAAKQSEPSVPSPTGEGANTAYIEDVLGSGITPNEDAPTEAVQESDAARYQRLKIIPLPFQVENTEKEVQCMYAGLAALKADNAPVDSIANYLTQLFGMNLLIANEFAKSVETTGEVFGFPLPTVPEGGWDFAAATPNVAIPKVDQSSQTTNS